MQPERYIMDVLYGHLRLPEYVWRVLPAPELQRLREVRLCNINSLCLTGGANINRYEHALGTAHLALELPEAVADTHAAGNPRTTRTRCPVARHQ